MRAVTLSDDQSFLLRRNKTLFVKIVGDWSCWLTADTEEGENRIADLGAKPFIGKNRLPNSGVHVILSDGEEPRFQIVKNGFRIALEDIMTSSPEWRNYFNPVIDEEFIAYADPLFNETRAFQERSDGIRIMNPDRWSYYLPMFYHWLLLKESPMICLHAALSVWENRSLIFIGPSKSGKSTLSWALHSLKADYYGDELIFFSLPEYQPFPQYRNLRLRPGGLEALGSPLPNPVWHEYKPNDKKCDVSTPAPKNDLPVRDGILFFLDGFADRPELSALEEREALFRTMADMNYGNPSLSAKISAAAGFINRYPHFRLKVGDPIETAQWILSFVDENFK